MSVKFRNTGFSVEPVEVFAGLVGRHDNCFLLETLDDDEQPQTSGLSYIGVAPKHHYVANGSEFILDGQAKQVSNPYQTLREQFKTKKGLPEHFVGGLVGYLSHEAMRYVEPSLEFPYDRQFPDFEFGEYDDGLVFKSGQSPQYFHYGEARLELYKGDSVASELKVKQLSSAKTKPQYMEMVARARRDIQAGRVFQAVLSNKYEYEFVGGLIQLYRELRQINPSPFMFFIKFGNRVTLGASPELLVQAQPDGQVFLEALAGTVPRGSSQVEDKKLAQQMLDDEKENAEHDMLVDLYRNDLSRVCQFGSVKVKKYKYIKQLSHVQHLCSLITGRLVPDKDMFDALAAAFPAGTLVGAPKIEAAKMLIELEGYERGPFGGSVGYIGYNSDMVQAVNIRSVDAVDDRLLVHSGSGIVYDSQPEKEYVEVSNKKLAREQALNRFLA